MPFKLRPEVRQAVHKKHKGRCGYCGTRIEFKDMEVDHIQARYRKGADHLDNLMPACRRCNCWKRAHTTEEFRNEISLQHERLLKKISGYKLAYDFGLIKHKSVSVKFYFEKGAHNETRTKR